MTAMRCRKRLDGAFSDLFGTDCVAGAVGVDRYGGQLSRACRQWCPRTAAYSATAEAHINADEAGAPEFFTHGAKLLPLAMASVRS